MRMSGARDLRRQLHWPVLLPMALLLLMGIVALSDIAIHIRGTGWVSNWDMKQLRWVLVGAAASSIVLLVPYKSMVERAYLAYGLNLLLLIVVLFAGTVKGSSRWIYIGGIGFQPSELMKLTLVLTLARFIRFKSSYKTVAGLAAPFLLTLVPMALILKQPDLGTALLCIPLLFVTLFVAGARPRHLLVIALLGALAIYPVYRFGMARYQQGRIDGFVAQLPLVAAARKMDKKESRALDRGNNYQVEQSKIAVGTGGWFGVGEDEGGVTAMRALPERHNDFIFPVIANRWGLFGCVVLLGLYLWLLCAVLAVAVRQRDPAGRLICVGVFALLGAQGFVNVAMTIGLMPITGMTLPFVSYGGTSLIVSMVAIALVCNVAARPSFEFGRGDFD